MSQSSPRVFRPVPVIGAPRMWFAILTALTSIVFAYLLYIYLQVPVIRYQIDGTTLVIHSALGGSSQDKKISLSRVSEVRPELLRGGSLRFGTEKPGYCVGMFAYPSLGEVSQVTDCSEVAVLMVTTGEVAPIVVTPADRDGFIKAMWAARPATFAPPARRGDSFWITLVTLIAVYAVIVAILATAFFIAPRRLAYVVSDGELRINTLFSHRGLALAKANVHRHRPLLGARLSGLFLPGYLVGSALYDGMATSVFASVRDEGVLVEGDGRFFLSPADPDGFLAALVQAGATLVTVALQRRR